MEFSRESPAVQWPKGLRRDTPRRKHTGWIALALGFPLVLAAAEPRPALEFELAARHANPARLGGLQASYVLRGLPVDGPCVATTWSKSYEDAMAVFYDAGARVIGTWRDEGGEMPMNITDGDLDGDGRAEILIVTRWNRPGAHVLGWDPQRRELVPRWSYRVDTNDRFYRGSAIGDFTAHPGREVVFGSSKGDLILLDRDGRLLAQRRLSNGKTVQRIDVADTDGDGRDEMIIATGRNPGEVRLVQWTPELRLDERWRTDVTPAGQGGTNCYEVQWHPHGHPEGGPAIAATTDQEVDGYKGSVALLDVKGRILWQRVFAPEEGRAGGCGFGDLDGDGRPEIVTRLSAQKAMVVYSGRGERLAVSTAVPTTAAGPQIVRWQPDGPVQIVSVGHVFNVVVRR
ncbi:MAG TPA: hypothetical protein VM165_18000 [Planctomycetaceae bacterium]|nr:hypothetical protein [Planctomycetaceae bacterium]